MAFEKGVVANPFGRAGRPGKMKVEKLPDCTYEVKLESLDAPLRVEVKVGRRRVVVMIIPPGVEL